MLKDTFISLLSKYTNDPQHITMLWSDIKTKHNAKNRYYHNLNHLENLYQNLIQVKENIKDWDMSVFVLFYHDYIYNILKKDNEERSALKAIEILTSLSIKNASIQHCAAMIRATQRHQISEDQDTNYFIDADLSILGSDWKNYQMYFENVRKEYRYYPDFMYSKGRIKVLQHFINMPRIFKTEYFFHTLEKQAKENLQQEIQLLSK